MKKLIIPAAAVALLFGTQAFGAAMPAPLNALLTFDPFGSADELVFAVPANAVQAQDAVTADSPYKPGKGPKKTPPGNPNPGPPKPPKGKGNPPDNPPAPPGQDKPKHNPKN